MEEILGIEILVFSRYSCQNVVQFPRILFLAWVCLCAFVYRRILHVVNQRPFLQFNFKSKCQFTVQLCGRIIFRLKLFSSGIMEMEIHCETTRSTLCKWIFAWLDSHNKHKRIVVFSIHQSFNRFLPGSELPSLKEIKNLCVCWSHSWTRLTKGEPQPNP